MSKLVLASVLAFAAIRVQALPFIEDNYSKAAALAKSKNVPIFVEAWAPW